MEEGPGSRRRVRELESQDVARFRIPSFSGSHSSRRMAFWIAAASTSYGAASFPINVAIRAAILFW